MDNYFTYFCLLTHLGVSNIWATETDYAYVLSLKKTTAKKKECGHFEHLKKKQYNFDSGWFKRQQLT